MVTRLNSSPRFIQVMRGKSGAMGFAFTGSEGTEGGGVVFFTFSHPGDVFVGREGFGVVVGGHVF